MDTTRVALNLSRDTLAKIDHLVRSKVFTNRSQAVEEALRQKLAQMNHERLAAECAKLDKEEEQRLAEEGYDGDLNEWPEY
jgi:Arc/MetJ-type ribon-helix-helix transcriptional regulator